MPNPNNYTTILNAEDASADFQSGWIDVAKSDRAFIQLTTADTMTGVLWIQGCNDPTIPNSADNLEDTDHTVDGIKTSYSWNLAHLAMRYIRVSFIHSSGSGTFDGTCNTVDDQ